ncbi:hypothetical protein ACH5RR_037568 [Cinchona calisaya]|uniref:Peptide N-acetyl-beta-D-glucosaminyl asparaginase amidase A N-terminal domain-containing protein n=1 Tax=Cinchona calisaya TaxID=153742 RepID=A0ABD2YAQ1_9GENT
MAKNFSLLYHILLPLLLLFHQSLFSSANNLYKTKSLYNSQLISEENNGFDESPSSPFLKTGNTPPTAKTYSPTTYFEVTKPIQLPNTKPCSQLILQHDFGFTYGKPPVLANYTPPSNCPSQKFAKVVLEWKATCKGRQFDRIFGIWLGGVEIFRSCTAEPRINGIVWTVEKDITRYSSLLMSNQTLAVFLGNLVDQTYTGVYHASISMHFYPAENVDDSLNSGADLILPISRDLPLNDGLWFEIQNSTDVESKEFKIPQNVYSNGPFREVLVSLDDVLVGSVWPFTVIYTGGINPLLWRPITGIGSFDLPTYDIEITPFLGNILDGKTHKFGFSVSYALNVWYIDANLHLWLDKKSEKIKGKLLSYDSSPLKFSLAENFAGFDGSFITNASRTITAKGWVKSSYGTIITKATQGFQYSNLMVVGNEGNRQIVTQTIDSNDKVSTSMPSLKSIKSLKHFLFSFFTDVENQVNGTYVSVSNVTLGFNEKKVKKSDLGSSVSSLENIQKGDGSLLIKGNSIIGGLGATRQVYIYKDDKLCYLRNVGSSNYTILYDKVSDSCSKIHKQHLLSKLGLLGQ